MANLDMKDLKDVDLYELLGIASTSTVSEVKKAYRKKALTCHPDKNPDNPQAAEAFQQLSKALEILIDESARAAYDRVLNGKKAAKLRLRELDEKRKKLKEDLLAREKAASEANAAGPKFDSQTDEEKLQAEIERLRKEGSRQVEEEVEFVRQQVLQESKETTQPEEQPSSGLNRLRIRWKASKEDTNNGGYSYDSLLKIMSKYGDIVALVISKKNGSALVEFKTRDAADTAFSLEKGFLANPLTVERLTPDGSKTQDHVSSQGMKLSEDVRTTIPSATIFPTLNSSGNPLAGATLPNFATAPDFSQLLYANYLTGQHLRYPSSVPGHGHAFPAQPTQNLMMFPGAGAMMMPGMTGMSGLSSLAGYGHLPQFAGYASHPLSYAAAGNFGALQGFHNGLQYMTAAVAGAPAPLMASARASFATGLPVFRGQMPSAYPSVQSVPSSAAMLFPQLLTGLPAVIPR